MGESPRKQSNFELLRPLYKCGLAPMEHVPQDANCGLWYDKFCVWSAERKNGQVGLKFDTDGDPNDSWSKAAWIRSVTGQKVGDQNSLKEAIERRHRMLLSLGGLPLPIRTIGRLVTGLGNRHPVENGFSWHPTLGTPYLAGSGLKGVARTWARLMGEDREQRQRVFGSEGTGSEREMGSVIFLEAIPRSPVQLVVEVMTPHYGPYHQSTSLDNAPGDYYSPVPIPFLAVEKDVRFLGGVLPRTASDSDQEDARLVHGWLLDALIELGAGAKTSSGYGRFEVDARGEKEWEELRRVERLRTAGPEERMRDLVAGSTERQVYQLAHRYLGKGELTDPVERSAFRRALLGSSLIGMWKKGNPNDPKAPPAGKAKLKEMARLILSEE